MPAFIHTILEKIADVLFPARCLGCRLPGGIFCETCRQKTQRKHREEMPLPHLDKIFSYGWYHDQILREALRRFKYHGIYGIAHPLAKMLHDILKPHLSSLGPEALIVPIPAHRARARERGYNQAELLARAFSEQISFPLDADILIKTKDTPSQISLKGRERLWNVKDSFGVQNAAALEGRTILLVDDISTTGATLSEAARVLKQSGAKEVIGLVVARG